jgi:low temperature requirement protein LtrA
VWPVSTDQTETAAPDESERHASWAELFFDLIAVAGVAALAHVLVGDLTPTAIGLYAVLFLAFWLTWTTYMLYGNVAGGETRIVRLLLGMFGLGVMAASVPGIAHTILDHGHESTHLNAFALAYFLARIVGSKSWGDGKVVLDFPVVQQTGGALPWLVSVWVPDDQWKLALWALGIAIDLVGIVLVSGDHVLASVSQRADAIRKRIQSSSRQSERGRARMADFTVAGINLSPEHLAERLGLFVIIVLGEGVIQVVRTAGQLHWHAHLLHAGLVSFLLLSGLFGLSVLYGHAGVPHLRPGSVSLRAALAFHGLVSATIAAVAVALAAVVESADEPLADDQRWLLCGAVAAYFAVGFAASLTARGFAVRRAAIWLVTGIGVPILLGFVADDVSGIALVWYVVLVVGGHVISERRAEPVAATT